MYWGISWILDQNYEYSSVSLYYCILAVSIRRVAFIIDRSHIKKVVLKGGGLSFVATAIDICFVYWAGLVVMVVFVSKSRSQLTT